MKEVVSISLGSSSRDHKATIALGDEKILMRREGTDGDWELCKQRFEELDGTVDCFGAGGFLMTFGVEDRIYELTSAKKLISGIKETPIVDGNGVKKTVERYSMQSDEIQEFIGENPGKALLTSAVDRYSMAQSVADAGYEITAGDLMFALGIPIKVKGLKNVRRLARVIMPIVRRFPLNWLYPLGEEQDKHTPKFEKHFRNNDLIAGDYLYVRRYAPEDTLEGKIILTNTTTASDIDWLKENGVRAVITTTPRLEGRSFGTNVFEAALTAYSGKNRPLTKEEITELISKFDIHANLHVLN